MEVSGKFISSKFQGSVSTKLRMSDRNDEHSMPSSLLSQVTGSKYPLLARGYHL